MIFSNTPPASLGSSFHRRFSANSSFSALKKHFAFSTARSQSAIPGSRRPSRPLKALLHTQESPQLQSPHAFTSYFAHTPGWGVPHRSSLRPASSFFFHTLATRRCSYAQQYSNSNPFRRLLYISLDTHGLPPYSPLSAKSRLAAHLKPVVNALQKRCPSSNVHLISGLVCPGGV